MFVSGVRPHPSCPSSATREPRGGRLALAAALLGVLLGVAACGQAPVALPRPAAPNVWPAYGHGLDNGFNNAADTAVTPANVRHLQYVTTVPVDAPVTSNPVVSATTVYFGTWYGQVVAANRETGKILWSRMVTGDDHAMVHGALAQYDGRLYVAATDGRVYALNPSTGAPIWVSRPLFPATTKDWIESGIQPYHGVLYIGIGGQNDVPTEWGGVGAVDAATGRVLWVTNLLRYKAWGSAVFGTPALIPSVGLLVVDTGNPVYTGAVPPGPNLYSDCIVAMSMRTGKVRWAIQTHHAPNDLDLLAAPAVWNPPGGGPTLVGAGEKDGNFYAVNLQTGRLAWKADLTPKRTETMVMVPAAVGDGRLFVGTFDQSDAVLSKGFVENYQEPATGRLLALSQRTGRLLWRFPTPAAVAAAPVLGDGLVFVESANGSLFALSEGTGKALWRGNAHGEVRHAEAALTLAGDELFVPLYVPVPGDVPATGGVAIFRLAQG